MLQWILDEARDRKESLDHVTMRLQVQNFSAIHTSSNASSHALLSLVYAELICEQSLTHALFHLLANPSIIPTLQEEIEEVLSGEGWTKTAFDKMWKLDSLLRESQRFTGITVCESSSHFARCAFD